MVVDLVTASGKMKQAELIDKSDPLLISINAIGIEITGNEINFCTKILKRVLIRRHSVVRLPVI